LPIIETEKSFYTDDKDFWWLIGYYLGDGWLAQRQYDIQLACNESKLAKLKEHISKEKYRYTVQENGTCYRLRFADKEMYNFIQQNIGTGCCEKHISLDIINLPKEQLLQVYEGYLASDGCVIGDKHQFTSVNRRMLYEFMLIVNKLFHKWACIYKVKTKDKTIIDGRTVNQKDWYQLRFSPLLKEMVQDLLTK
jgi:intein/homing endonuclease